MKDLGWKDIDKVTSAVEIREYPGDDDCFMTRNVLGILICVGNSLCWLPGVSMKDLIHTKDTA